LKEIEKSLNSFRQNHLESRVNIPTGKPIGTLARSFNEMADRLQLLITNRKHLIQAVSHEIRTPIYRIHFHLEAIVNEEDVDAISCEVDDIREEIGGLNGLAEELQALTEKEGWRFKDEEIPIYKELFDMVAHLKKAHSHLSIMLSEGDATTIHAHPVYFRRVIQNVLSNAVSHARAHVSIRYGIIKSVAFIEICDDGPGIPANAREAVFEPFMRLDESRNRKTGGFGLGLAITRRIITRYHGVISVSDNKPQGAKFTIHWPLCKKACGTAHDGRIEPATSHVCGQYETEKP
jgi:signal transduction histidine kinase